MTLGLPHGLRIQASNVMRPIRRLVIPGVTGGAARSGNYLVPDKVRTVVMAAVGGGSSGDGAGTNGGNGGGFSAIWLPVCKGNLYPFNIANTPITSATVGGTTTFGQLTATGGGSCFATTVGVGSGGYYNKNGGAKAAGGGGAAGSPFGNGGAASATYAGALGSSAGTPPGIKQEYDPEFLAMFNFCTWDQPEMTDIIRNTPGTAQQLGASYYGLGGGGSSVGAAGDNCPGGIIVWEFADARG